MTDKTAVALPDHVASVVQDAHDKWQAYENGTGSLHDSSMATIAARSAVCGWAMDFIYKREQQDLGLLCEGDNTADAMKEAQRRRAMREETQRRSA